MQILPFIVPLPESDMLPPSNSSWHELSGLLAVIVARVVQLLPLNSTSVERLASNGVVSGVGEGLGEGEIDGDEL